MCQTTYYLFFENVDIIFLNYKEKQIKKYEKHILCKLNTRTKEKILLQRVLNPIK